jgi:Rieske Fe-S protein
MQRREFIKTGCKACLLVSAIAGVSELASCGAAFRVYKTSLDGNQVNVPLELFSKNTFQIVSPSKYGYEIAVQKNPDNSFRALLLRCTHQSNQLTPTGKGYLCTFHGSKFDKMGNVSKGPAEQPLKVLPTTTVGNQLIIYL